MANRLFFACKLSPAQPKTSLCPLTIEESKHVNYFYFILAMKSFRLTSAWGGILASPVSTANWAEVVLLKLETGIDAGFIEPFFEQITRNLFVIIAGVSFAPLAC